MKILTSILILWAQHASALSYEIVGPCSATPAYSGNIAVTTPLSAGQATLDILEGQKIPYIGSVNGFNSIMNTPTDDDAIEVLSPTELRAYGWCYEVDGLQPSLMPNEFLLNGSEKLRWFYAFSLFSDGKWVSYCDPAYEVKPASLCPDPK